jgi:hypothetical protein
MAEKQRKSAWFYIAWIIGMCLLFVLLLFTSAFVYSAITGDKQILREILGSIILPLI